MSSNIILPQKLPATGTTIFSVMTSLAQQHQAINLSQGFPDFDIDPLLKHQVEQAIQDGHNQYAPMPGLLQLRKVIAEKISQYQQVTVDPDAEITITPGATYGIYTAFTTLLKAGDEVIVPEPAYDSYLPNILLNGGIPVTVPIDTEAFRMDWQAVERAISPATKGIIINNPHNPLGFIYSREDLEQLAVIVCRHNLWVIADEVYEHLVYDGQQHISVLQLPGLRERSFVVHSFGKVFNTTGWKIGYCIAPTAWTKNFRTIHQFLCFSVNTPAQQGLAGYLENFNHIEDTRQLIEQKRNFFLQQMQDTPFTWKQPASGSFFQVMDYSNISTLPDKEFAQWLTTEHGVAVIPVSAFYRGGSNERLVRFCFAKQESTLAAAAEKLRQLPGLSS